MIVARIEPELGAAKRAIALDDLDAVSHFAVGRVHLARGEYELSIAELQTAIDLNPCLAQAHCGLGDSLAYCGALDESISAFEEAIRLSPHDPYHWGFMTYRALAHVFLKEHDEAADWARKAAMVPNSQYWANAHLVAALGHLDRSAETKAALSDLLRLKPEFSVDFARTHLFYIKDPEQIGHYLDSLKKAGLPD